MERRFDLLTRQIKTNFWATVWPYVRTDRRGGVSGKTGRIWKGHFFPQNFAIWGTDRKFGTWPSSRARSTYYYYTTPGRTCQVFFEWKNKKTEDFTPRCRRYSPRDRSHPTQRKNHHTLQWGFSVYTDSHGLGLHHGLCSEDSPNHLQDNGNALP